MKVHEAKRNEFTYGFGFEVDQSRRQHSQRNRRAAQSSAGRPAFQLHRPARSRSTARVDRSSTRATICAAKANRFRSPHSPDASINAQPSTTSTHIFAGHRGSPPFRSPLNATKRIRSFRHSRRSARYQIQRFIDRAKKNLFFVVTASARLTLLALRFPNWFPPQISTSVSPALEQTSHATHATTFSMNTKACSVRSKSISTPANSAPASILPSSPRRLLSTKRSFITSSGPTAFASVSRSPSPTAASL